MAIQQNISLKPFNTFGIDVPAEYFAAFTQVDELLQYLDEFEKEEKLILGGGSNILFTRPVKGLVLHNRIKGIRLVKEDNEYYYVSCGGGEDWHTLVEYCVNHNYAGIENMALIPGSAGAAPVQNIGAYGVELKDVLFSLQALHRSDKSVHQFDAADCGFGYRDSVFKSRFPSQFVILEITLRLRKKPQFHTSYGAITKQLEEKGVKELSPRAIADAVIAIRRSKLPDPKMTGNAGSFFKNPSVPVSVFKQLQVQFPSVIGYPSGDSVKLAAGWLIEQCGWKGFRRGDAGCHDKQALVLVNYGKATGTEISQLAADIQQSVQDMFGVLLEKEVNIY